MKIYINKKPPRESIRINFMDLFQCLKVKKWLSIPLLLSSTWVLAEHQEASLEDFNENNLEYALDSMGGNTLVELNLSNGNTITFMRYGDVFQISESGHTGANEISLLEQLEGNPLDKFLQLTSEETPIPKALLEFSSPEKPDLQDNQKLNYEGVNEELVDVERMHMVTRAFDHNEIRRNQLKDRQVVNELQGALFTDLEQPQFKALDLSTKGAGQGSCNNSTGYLYFEDNHCGINGSKGKGSTASSCDRAMHNYVNRWSTSGKRVTFTRAAYCGNDSAYINHYTYFSQWNQGWVKLGPTIFLDPYTFRTLETWSGKYDLPRKRRAYINRTSNSGYVRAWNKFYRKVK